MMESIGEEGMERRGERKEEGDLEIWEERVWEVREGGEKERGVDVEVVEGLRGRGGKGSRFATNRVFLHFGLYLLKPLI